MARGGGSSEVGIVLFLFAAFVIYNIAVALGIILIGAVVIWSIYLLVRAVYVGSVKNFDEAAVFTKVSKYIYTHKKEPVIAVKTKYQLSNQLYDYVIDLMELSGIVSERNGILSRSLTSIWSLGRVFKQINRNASFFDDQISKIVDTKKAGILEQIQTETDEFTLSVLHAYFDSCEHSIALTHLYIREQYLATLGDASAVNPITLAINNHKQSIESTRLNLYYGRNDMSFYSKLVASSFGLNNSGFWSSHGKNRIEFVQSAGFLSINDEAVGIPAVTIDGYTLLFLPQHVVEVDNIARNYVVKVFRWNDLVIGDNKKTYCLEDTNWFSSGQAEFAYRSWLHQRVNGGPDLRYNYNPSSSYYYFREIVLSNSHFEVLCGSSQIADTFIKSVKAVQLLSLNGSTDSAIPPSLPFERSASASQCSAALIMRIQSAFASGAISKDSVYNKNIVSILNDFQVFQDIEDRVFAKILKAAESDGTIEKVTSFGITSMEQSLIIDSFIQTSGYDAEKAQSIINVVINMINQI